MRFALIGNSAEASFLAAAIDASGDHELGCCCVTGDLAQRLGELRIAFELVASPEDALLDQNATAVIVAYTDAETSIAQSRQASQADRSVAVIPPFDASTAFSYELHLLLDESHYGIVAVSGRWYLNPMAREEVKLDADQVQQLSVECRYNSDDAGAELRFIDAFCGLGLPYNRITGIDLNGADGELLSRSITLASTGEDSAPLPPAIANLKSDSASDSDAEIAVQGSMDNISTALPNPATSKVCSDAAPLVERLVQTVNDQRLCHQAMEEFSNSLEIRQALDKSLRRRRTVDVYFDGVSEKGVFKTQMTAIGCGLLGYMTFGLVAYLIFAQLFSPPVWMLHIARALWIAPVVIFLFAQLLLPLARDRGASAK